MCLDNTPKINGNSYEKLSKFVDKAIKFTAELRESGKINEQVLKQLLMSTNRTLSNLSRLDWVSATTYWSER